MDDQAFEPFVSWVRAPGVGFTTMADLGDTAENGRGRYELNKACAADLPERGSFYSECPPR